jgi:hypothetical protein
MDDYVVRHPEPDDIVLTTVQRSMKARMLRVLEALEAGHSRASAASMAKMAPATIDKWVRAGRTQITHPLYPWFLHEIERSEGLGESLFANIVIKEAAEKHNWRAAMFLLQKRYKWNDRPDMDKDIQREQQKAQLQKTKADTVYVEERTRVLKEDGEEVVLDRLRDILNEVREEVKPKEDKAPESLN